MMEFKSNAEEKESAIWYLKVLQQESGHWQQECRHAIDYAIKKLDTSKKKSKESTTILLEKKEVKA